MTTVNIHEAKTHLSRLLERAVAGERIVIAKAGTPLVELTPVRRMDVVFGGLKGAFGDYDAAFTDEAEAEIAATWDEDLGIESTREGHAAR